MVLTIEPGSTSSLCQLKMASYRTWNKGGGLYWSSQR